jgi:hypothetical protein
MLYVGWIATTLMLLGVICLLSFKTSRD